MEVSEIIESIKLATGKFAREAVESAIARREEVTPALLAILEEVANLGAAVDDTGNYIAPLYAMFLLSQFRETRAYPLMVRIALLPGDDLDSLFGDFITESLDSALASVCGGDLSGIQSIVECESADEWARGAAIDSFVTLVAAGLVSRQEVLDYYGTLYHGKLARTPENERLWGSLVCSTADLYPEELIGEIEWAYRNHLVDTGIVRLEVVRRDLAKGREQVLAELAANPKHRLIEDTVKEFGRWYCFHSDERPKQDRYSQNPGPLDPEERPALWSPLVDSSSYALDSVGTVRRTESKVGRNEPCPCGSGKKYKKCCGA